MDLDYHVYIGNYGHLYRKANHKNQIKWKFMWTSTHRGRASELIYFTVFVIFSLKIYFLSMNINVMSHMIYIMLFYKKYCSLYLFPTTHGSSTGVTARSNYVIISIYLPHDPGKIMKRNHKTLKQLIVNKNNSIFFTLVLTLIRER